MTPSSSGATAGQDLRIEFVRRTQLPVTAALELRNEPRNRRHMPLCARFTDETAAGRGAAKDDQWQRTATGPWAVLVEGEFAGWGGVQREEYGATMRSSLRAQRGRGREITLVALRCGYELGFRGEHRTPTRLNNLSIDVS
jgi:[ribosomal protein S5]-alanine N-acetyltransferase